MAILDELLVIFKSANQKNCLTYYLLRHETRGFKCQAGSWILTCRFILVTVLSYVCVCIYLKLQVQLLKHSSEEMFEKIHGQIVE
jgi:hypothetical protein